jgi:Toastrack DUF4097
MPPIALEPGRQPVQASRAALVRRRNLFGALAAFFLALVLGTAVLDEATSIHEDRSFAVGASPGLVVRDHVGGGLRGGIAVRGADGDRVHVEGKVHGSWRVRYQLEQRGDEVVLEVEPRPFLGWLSLLGPARFAITAPARTRLDVESRSAPIRVQGITGGGKLETTNGGIQIDGAGGRLAAVATNGGIDVDGFAGTAEMRTTNGAIDVRGGSGTFDLTTTNGAISLDAELAPAGRSRAETTNGGIAVRLRGAPSLRVDASTTNGAVDVRRPIEVREQGPSALAGTIGAGTGELWLRTTNGGIAIE